MSKKQKLIINALDIINAKNGYCFVITYDPEQIGLEEVYNMFKQVQKNVKIPVLCLPKSMQYFYFKDKEACIRKLEEWLQRMKNDEDIC